MRHARRLHHRRCTPGAHAKASSLYTAVFTPQSLHRRYEPRYRRLPPPSSPRPCPAGTRAQTRRLRPLSPAARLPPLAPLSWVHPRGPRADAVRAGSSAPHGAPIAPHGARTCILVAAYQCRRLSVVRAAFTVINASAVITCIHGLYPVAVACILVRRGRGREPPSPVS